MNYTEEKDVFLTIISEDFISLLVILNTSYGLV